MTNLFSVMVLITILSFILCSNKLGNNFNSDTNLVMLTFSLLVSNEKVLSCNWLATKLLMSYGVKNVNFSSVS